MKHSRSMQWNLILIASLLVGLLAPMAQAQDIGPTQAEPVAGQALVLLERPQLDAVERVGVPIYARVSAGYLAGATPAQQDALRSAGVRHRVLDSDLTGADYYILYARQPNQWGVVESRGTLLFAEELEAVARVTPDQAEALPEVGFEIRRVTLTPKPLRIHPSTLPTAIEPDPVINAILDMIDQNTVEEYDGNLSGEWPVSIGGEPYTIQTRNSYQTIPIEKATQYAYEFFQGLGLDVQYHTFPGPGQRNVIATKPGLLYPDTYTIICAHLDDMPSGPIAPGADDNASGSVAVMIAAELLSQFEFENSLIFALWTGEEQGLVGSHYYAQDAYNQGMDIQGVLNLDMIAWDAVGGPDIDLHADQAGVPPSMQLAQLMADVIGAYSLDLTPQIIPNGTGASDHASFWDYGYTAILGIEDDSDFNDYYHTTNDRLMYLNLPYFTEFVRAAVGTYAHMSGLIPSDIGYLDGHVTGIPGSVPIADAHISITEQGTGNTYATTTDASGYYTQTLLPGFYDVLAEAYGWLPGTAQNVQVMTDTVTTADLELQPAPVWTISGQVTEAGTGAPLLAEIEVVGAPIPPVMTNPSDGSYSVDVAEGNYTLKARSYGHEAQAREVVVDQNLVEDFALEILPCILVVDDDGDGPDVRTSYTGALDSLGLDYNVWDVLSQGDPSVDDLMGYQTVIWFNGYPYSNTFNSDNEAAVGAYLDAGGRFFFSSQDYLYDVGLTAFGQNYLHISSYTSDVSQTTVTGQGVFAGLGPYSLSYPFTNYSDVVNPDAQAAVAFSGNQGNAAVSFENATFKSVFLGYPLEAIPGLADRAAVLSAAVDWFGGCGQPLPKMFIGNIKTKYRVLDPGPPAIYKVLGRIPIFDESITPVIGATVTAQWELPGGQIKVKTATTRPNGSAYFKQASPQQGLWVITALDVQKDGLEYDPAMNFETSEELMIP
jgi:hypothetical protein